MGNTNHFPRSYFCTELGNGDPTNVCFLNEWVNHSFMVRLAQLPLCSLHTMALLLLLYMFIFANMHQDMEMCVHGRYDLLHSAWLSANKRYYEIMLISFFLILFFFFLYIVASSEQCDILGKIIFWDFNNLLLIWFNGYFYCKCLSFVSTSYKWGSRLILVTVVLCKGYSLCCFSLYPTTSGPVNMNVQGSRKAAFSCHHGLLWMLICKTAKNIFHYLTD